MGRPGFLPDWFCSSGSAAASRTLFGRFLPWKKVRISELLIVVAIIAALVGVAVPMFQSGIAPCHRAKALQDLDTIRHASYSPGSPHPHHRRPRLVVEFNKPFSLTGDPVPDLVVLVGQGRGTALPLEGWEVVPGGDDPAPQVSSDPGAGVLVLEPVAGSDSKGAGTAPVLPRGAALDIRRSLLAKGTDDELRSRSVIRERVTPGGPCDPELYGAHVIQPDGAHPHDLVSAEERGVPIKLAN